MAMKDITDLQVLQAYADAKGTERWPYDLLVERTGEPEKVCYRCMERAADRGLIEYGVSLRTGWITPEGHALLGTEPQAFWKIPNGI